jgi:hypothetical protein
VVPLPEGGGGPSRFPGNLRRGPVHPARRDRSRGWPRSRSSEGSPKRPDVEAATRRPESCASGVSSSHSEERSLGLRHCLPSETGPRRQATGRPARGQTIQRWLGQLRLEALPKQAGSRLSRGSLPEQACSGTFREVGAIVKRKLRRTLVPTPNESAFRSPEGSHEVRGQAACQSLPGLGKSHRATGYV